MLLASFSTAYYHPLTALRAAQVITAITNVGPKPKNSNLKPLTKG